MKVIVFLLVLAVMQPVIQSQSFPGTGELPMTRRPPKRELEYWCTYAKSCDFCWNCRHGVCKNKVLKNTLSSKKMITYKYVGFLAIMKDVATLQTLGYAAFTS